MHELHSFDVKLLAMESRTRQLNARDVQVAQGARYQLPKGAQFRINHIKGTEEPLCWAADIVAGALRAR